MHENVIYRPEGAAIFNPGPKDQPIVDGGRAQRRPRFRCVLNNLALKAHSRSGVSKESFGLPVPGEEIINGRTPGATLRSAPVYYGACPSGWNLQPLLKMAGLPVTLAVLNISE